MAMSALPGLIIRLFRLRQGWTLDEMAEHLSAWLKKWKKDRPDLWGNTINRWELEQHRPPEDVEFRLKLFMEARKFDWERWRAATLMIDTLKLVDKHETRDHCIRVSDLAVKIATRVYDKTEKDYFEKLFLICLGGVLHDIGKLVSDVAKLVTLPRKLEQDERLIVNTHANLGAVILERIAGEKVCHEGGAAHHHENLNGTGYPGGLRGKLEDGGQIPMSGRILRVADEWDSRVVSKREYRGGTTEDADKVLAEMMLRAEWDDPELDIEVMRTLREIERYRPKTKETDERKAA